LLNTCTKSLLYKRSLPVTFFYEATGVDLAKKIGVNEMTIVNWERGKTKPDKRKFEKLKKILRSPMPSNWTGKL
jgi:transcriptional regulator with XRE-family HTH domain